MTQLLFSQHAGYPAFDHRSNSTYRSYNQNDLISAKCDSDRCMAWNKDKNLLIAKNWYYRGLIYQKFYEDFDSLNTSFENKYFNKYKDNEINHIFGRLTKDTTLIISIESYVNCICCDIKNDTLSFDMLISDSIYRKQSIEKFNTFNFDSDNYMTPLKDTILPQILEYLNNGALRKSENEQVYIDILSGIIEK